MLCNLWCLLTVFSLNVDGVKCRSFSSTVVSLYLVIISCLENTSSSQDDISILDFSIICFFMFTSFCVCDDEDWTQSFTHARKVLCQLNCVPSSCLAHKPSGVLFICNKRNSFVSMLFHKIIQVVYILWPFSYFITKTNW